MRTATLIRFGLVAIAVALFTGLCLAAVLQDNLFLHEQGVSRSPIPSGHADQYIDFRNLVFGKIIF